MIQVRMPKFMADEQQSKWKYVRLDWQYWAVIDDSNASLVMEPARYIGDERPEEPLMIATDMIAEAGALLLKINVATETVTVVCGDREVKWLRALEPTRPFDPYSVVDVVKNRQQQAAVQMSVLVNGALLAALLTAMPEQTVMLELSGPNEPIIIRATDDSDMVGYIMPMTVRRGG